MNKEIARFDVPELNKPISHYCDAVAAGGLLFISGCAPLDSEGALVGENDIRSQARQVFNNMEKILRHTGCDVHDVLKVNVYLADANDRVAVNEVRKTVFGDTRPASTLLQIPKFAVEGMLIEVEAVAAMRE